MTGFVHRWVVRKESWLSPRSRTLLQRSHTTTMHISTTIRRCLCAGLLPLALASCGGSGPKRPDGGTVASPSTTTSTAVHSPDGAAAPTPEDAVLDSYRRFDAVVNAYGQEEGPFDADDLRTRLSAVATNGEFDQLFERLQLNRIKGWVYRGGEGDQHRPVVQELTAGRAVLIDCADDTGGIYDTRQGQFVEPATPGAKTLSRVVLSLDGTAWKVAAVTVEGDKCG